ncbi:MFS family permease [Nitrobacteraceae bacterium AZCC 1564]
MAFAHTMERGQFTGRAAVALVAAQIAIMFVGAVLPTPLYPLYQQHFQFSNVVLTLIYAVYVLGNLIALLIFGRLSDQIGRRNASLPAIGFGILSTILFLFAQSTAWLFAARLVSGFATGLASGTAAAWLAELLASVPNPKFASSCSALRSELWIREDTSRPTILVWFRFRSSLKNSQEKSGELLNHHTSGGKSATGRIASIANFIGLAAGTLVAGLLAAFAPWPLHLSFVVYLLFLLALGAAIAFTFETVDQPISHLRDLALKPRLGVPPKIRIQFISPAVTGFVVFALIGFYAALIPNLLSDSLGQKSPAVSGGTVFELFAVAALCVMLTARLNSRTASFGALVLLPPSVWLLVTAELTHSILLLLGTTALGGLSAALGYRGSLEEVSRIAPADQRSEVVSSYLIAVYAGNSVPVIGIGLLAAVTSSTTAHVSFAAIITVLACIAFIVGVKARVATNRSS